MLPIASCTTPVAIPSSQELAVMARLEQRLAPTTSEPTDKPNIGVCGAATLQLLLDAFRYAGESSGDLGFGTDEWSELLRAQKRTRLKNEHETRKQRCQ